MTRHRTEPSIWIAHDGGGRPHSPSETVEILFRDNTRAKCPSGFACWTHAQQPTPRDVMAFRFIPPEMTRTPWENIQTLFTSGAAVTLVCRPQDRIGANVYGYVTYERLWDSFLTPKDKERAALKGEDLLEIEVKLDDTTVHRLGYDAEALLVWATIQVRSVIARREAA